MTMQEGLEKRLAQRPRHRVTGSGAVVLDPAAAVQNVGQREAAWATVAAVANMPREKRREVFRRLSAKDRAALKRDIKTYRAQHPSA